MPFCKWLGLNNVLACRLLALTVPRNHLDRGGYLMQDLFLQRQPDLTTCPYHHDFVFLRAEERINVHKKLAPKRVVLSLTIILHR